jgi:hypothetical protein
MGCCTSSPHGRRRYRDPADLDEEFVLGDEESVPIRYVSFFFLLVSLGFSR